MDRVRTALIGCGKVGRIHAQALATLAESDFVAVCDVELDRASGLAAQYDTAAYNDVGLMLDLSKVQALCIATPHPLHAPPALLAAQAGAHVLVEKPLAASLADCDAMLEAAGRSQIKLGVISQRR